MGLSSLWYSKPVAVVSLARPSSLSGSGGGGEEKNGSYSHSSSVTARDSEYSGEVYDKESLSGCDSSNSGRCPAGLRLDEILDGHTCPPASIRDFHGYLSTVEYSSENLAFVLWLRDYQNRFDALPEEQKALCPPISSSAVNSMAAPRIPMLKVKGIAQQQQGEPSETAGEWSSGKATPAAEGGAQADMLTAEQIASQPFRQEVSQVIITFFTSSGSKELNLPSALRTNTIRAARANTHPSVFQAVYQHVYYLLYASSHPNFIRYTICNGNAPRVWFARGLGIALMVFGVIEAIVCIGKGVARGWRCFAIPLWLFGCATFVTALYGLCVVLHGFKMRQLHPWELLDDWPEANAISTMKPPFRFTTLFRVFDKQVWVEEPALRQLHSRIFYQAMVVAIAFTGVMCAIFLAVPNA